MSITGEMLIGQTTVRGKNGQIHGIDAATGETLAPAFGGATPDDLENACALAQAAFDAYRETTPERRAVFLEAIASNILALGDALIERCMAETGLPRGRLEGERARTISQLALFASVVREGSFLDVRIDPARPDRTPLPRADIRLRNIGIGPVAVFGASNFPLAFSVAGGDTVSALAAGCPVIVKAHSAHPGTSELVGQAIQRSVRECNLAEGVFSLIFDSQHSISQALVADHRIKAVGFTGSQHAGVTLMNIAAARREPIPVYAEMSAINPVVLLPHALAERGAAIADTFIASLTVGAGQFCTNPGLILAIEGPPLAAFERAAVTSLSAIPAATMLTCRIYEGFCEGVEKLRAQPDVELLGRGRPGECLQGQAALFATRAHAFLAHTALRHEVFGASSLIVRCPDADTLLQVIEALEGQLTIAVHASADDYPHLGALVPTLEKKAGRILLNGFGTGVEVCNAMVHGGPFPATSDPRTTSVGSLAINRFLRPVSYQDFPEALLPPILQDANPFGISRRVDGRTEP
ncbi:MULTISPECIES: aldehyde dehydrogenase (NADP(+)) [Pseudomonas]|uniref:Aldehyde dehydrogenase (NADP(+)) n=1 Tax=Pseudomonas azadiae TaxID=2843612 RepID=A0ABS6P5Q0_9PSED|nr:MULTISPECIES: aldehyde dehydrogenase (NADP(+)) [Pseudomonas]MBV4455806.1 aldehyde dehydrogenase (NADP(+)) [Pseudomonas azadiae]NMF41702.1 aldehyde dehydrogenase (NADP(+)) [Pseudomonas sp. SWRI 103]